MLPLFALAAPVEFPAVVCVVLVSKNVMKTTA